ncbi:MAG TPA: hypothetical protein VFV66_01505 [Nonomuraea sp.]|nr:hypothetical protein [Nonomuraea sp.]
MRLRPVYRRFLPIVAALASAAALAPSASAAADYTFDVRYNGRGTSPYFSLVGFVEGELRSTCPGRYTTAQLYRRGSTAPVGAPVVMGCDNAPNPFHYENLASGTYYFTFITNLPISHTYGRIGRR